MSATRIATTDVELSLQISGPEDAPVVVLVHGYPDNRTVWDLVVDDLERDHRVATYDVRGAGESTAPPSRAGYKMNRLVDDLVAVLDEVAPDGRPVHLVGHDWGSVPALGCRDARVERRPAAGQARVVHVDQRPGPRPVRALPAQRTAAAAVRRGRPPAAALLVRRGLPAAVRARARVLAPRRTHPRHPGEASAASTATGTTRRSARTPATASTSTAPTGSTSAARPPRCRCS